MSSVYKKYVQMQKIYNQMIHTIGKDLSVLGTDSLDFTFACNQIGESVEDCKLMVEKYQVSLKIPAVEFMSIERFEEFKRMYED